MPAIKRPDTSKRTVEERNVTFQHYLHEVHSWATCMDRVLFRKNLKLLAEFVKEESVAFELTPAERKRWNAIVATALNENKPAALHRHLERIHEFWRAYHSSL